MAPTTLTQVRIDKIKTTQVVNGVEEPISSRPIIVFCVTVEVLDGSEQKTFKNVCYSAEEAMNWASRFM